MQRGLVQLQITPTSGGTTTLLSNRRYFAFANDQWIGEHYTEEQAVEAVMDRFRRLVEAELEMVEVRVAVGN